jgi:transposase
MRDWHRAHGRNVARTARHFGFSRPTVYRWLERYDRLRLESLEDRSSRPARPPPAADLDDRAAGGRQGHP